MTRPLLSVAPMVDWTDRHCRFFHRQLALRSLLYTEMQTTGAVLRGKSEQILDFDPREKPLALQIAGDSTTDVAASVRKAEAWPYDEINLNCGCPSDKVQNAHFGACLMGEPGVVADLVKAMKDSTSKPVTVKHRIGIEGHGVRRETYEEMAEFVSLCADAGADRFIIHARIAILEGLDPRQNREIPPLRYDDVYLLKQDFPHLCIEINGGIRSLEALVSHSGKVDGVMLGRAAYEDPYFLTVAENHAFGPPSQPITRRSVLQAMILYMDEWEARGLAPHKIFRHMTDLFAGFRGARKWRQLLSPPYKSFEPMSAVLEAGMRLFDDETLDTTAYRPAPLPKAETSPTL
ncbi:MAG: tRNA dihydrouridine(20/20a) synthase DusA [Spirochaetales bacterium]